MKNLLLAAACVACVGAMAADGSIAFGNANSATGTGNKFLTDVDGTTRLAGTDYYAQLFAGPSADSLLPVSIVATFGTGTRAGIISAVDPNNVVYLSTVPAGGTAFVQLRAWAAVGGNTWAGGSTYDGALGGKSGQSAVFQVATGNVGVPPSTEGPLAGLNAFSLTANPIVGPIVPEPTTIALGAMGVAALLLRRRS